MWFNKEVFERLERLSGRFLDMDEFVAKELQSQRNKVAMLEKEVVELKWVKHRVKTLDSQVNDLMNENVDLISHLRVIENKLSPNEKELKIYRDEERGGYVLKEKELEPRIGDLVVYKTNPTIIRTVTNMSVDHIKLENGNFQRLYNGSDWIQRFQMDWKLLVKKEDFK